MKTIYKLIGIIFMFISGLCCIPITEHKYIFIIPSIILLFLSHFLLRKAYSKIF
jgi:hypothetical protein